MVNLIGTYECTLDSKGRMLLPSGLKKQMDTLLQEGFVLKRSVFQPCLELHPMSEWNQVMGKINKLNRFVKKNNDFIRQFTAGLKNVEIDTSGRLQISKDLIQFAKLEKNIVVAAAINVIEIWDKNLYEDSVNVNDLDFANLAEEVMGNISEDELS
ncbi:MULTISPECIES: division/cell wall cluster transcriptional repressor MraZ [Apibacter]|uniref:division/cell wall cluster transcriptional repressor MraZ n=1 Tax=Apibacter TaxID=1778601 RepID=UPI000CF8B5BC|nr:MULTISPECIES: division/cell wall cluster transcriptional repressor MraZ [Apibacter]MCX8677257.1 division/cell wall cluster transcriptional repressor MraZ [Apibacter sp. B3919]MXO23681.1 division/cell wall cluster transcriptional repressor MraZ [Apibacter sp. B3924]MXO26730.1 division/cell wall cluster transcriptional repressor MraZ [Apibacter sp. B3813]MXO28700.1 division/cell wall cluster transcriptional repressor MraZ [Apibacter sp. B3913]MXO30654.1 division/cell wall cluster transcriptio